MFAGNRALSPLEAHVVVGVFHIDDGMFSDESVRCRDVGRTIHIQQVKVNHYDSQFRNVQQHVSTTAASKLFHRIVQFTDYSSATLTSSRLVEGPTLAATSTSMTGGLVKAPILADAFTSRLGRLMEAPTLV